jgi:hypothetical protein
MSGKYSSLSRQLAKVERKLANRARREKLANCICGGTIIALSMATEQFEAEMNRTCPVHGFRRFGHIDALIFECPDGDETLGPPEYERNEPVKLEQLVKTYELRYWEDLKSRVELEEDEENES